jgi:16S rRNA G527 N7-methylase RsmG
VKHGSGSAFGLDRETVAARLRERALRYGIRVPDFEEQVPKLARLAAEIATGGWRLGLTKYNAAAEVLERLMLPALVALRWLAAEEVLRVVDVGAGAGGAGLTLALLVPRWRVIMADRRQRAAAFCELLAVRLGVSNVQVLVANLPRDGHGLAPADAALFRAVGSPAEDLDMAATCVRPGGKAIIWTSEARPQPRAEGWSLLERLELPAERLLVLAFVRVE